MITNPNCYGCGKFVSWTADQATYWGNATMTEPPDPHYYCDACAEESKTEAVKRGYVMNAWWCKPRWAIEAQEELARSLK